MAVVEYLLQHNADVHAKDKGGLVPLHNSCSYGHFEVTELLVSHGANVNVTDLWKFTPVSLSLIVHTNIHTYKYKLYETIAQRGRESRDMEHEIK